MLESSLISLNKLHPQSQKSTLLLMIMKLEFINMTYNKTKKHLEVKLRNYSACQVVCGCCTHMKYV